MDKKYGFALILLILVVHLFWGIGDIPLLDPDEPVYAETAREMIVFNDYLSPRIYNEYWYDKPPMYYWLVSFAQNIFGDSEFSARFPSAFFGVATLASLYLGIRKKFDSQVAAWSVLILGTCIEFFYLAKAAVTDMTLLFFMTSAILAFFNEKYLLLYIFMGLATLTKGPIGVAFPGAIIFFYLLFTSKWQLLKKMKIFHGAIIFSLIAIPWYYLMYQVHGQVFIDTFLGFHNITRFTTPEHPTRVLWWYYIPVLLIGIFPWTGVLLNSFKTSITDSTSEDMKKLLFMNIWWIFIFLFFSIAQTKLVSYIFPIFPPIAVIIAWNIVQLNGKLKNSKNVYLASIEFFFYLLLAGVWFYLGKQFPEVQTSSLILAVTTLLLGLGIVFSYVKFKDITLAAILHVLTGMITMLLVFSFILPNLTDKFSMKTVSSYYQDYCDQDKKVFVDKFLRPGFMYYTHTPGKEIIPKTNDLKNLLHTKKNVYIIVRDLELNRLKDSDKKHLNIIYSKDGIKIISLK